MSNKRGGSSASSKGKKSNSDKPPRRGLGVDQLEKILHGQMASPYGPYPGDFNHEDMRAQKAHPSFSYSSTSWASYGLHPGMMMGHYECDQRIIYADSFLTTTTSWRNRNGIMDGQYFAQPNKTRQLLNLLDSRPTKSKQRSKSPESSCQNCESGDTGELDLELRLSL